MTGSITANGHDTPRQTRANQANSKLSTGPKTEAGKSRSAQNATTTHGLTARPILLPTENPAFESHAQKFFDEYQPKTATETELVRALAGATLQLRRTDRIFLLRSPARLRPRPPIPHPLRQIERTHEEVHKLQRERRYDEEDQMRKAASLLPNGSRKRSCLRPNGKWVRFLSSRNRNLHPPPPRQESHESRPPPGLRRRPRRR